MYYAQITNGVVTAVTQFAEPNNAPNLVEIDNLNTSLLGHKYENGQFIPVSLNSIPHSVTMRQARLALLAVDLLDDVEAAVASQGRAAQIEWEYATDVQRTHPLIAAVQAAKGLTDADVDQLFLAAAGM